MIGQRKLSFEIPVNWLLAPLVVALALLGLFIFGPKAWHPYIIFGAAVLGGAAALTTAINALDSRISQAKSARVEAALGFIYRWCAPEQYHAKKGGREVILKFQPNPRIDERLAYFAEDADRHANFTDILNFMEALGIAIHQDVACPETCKRFFRTIVVQYWHAAELTIRHKRAERNNARLYKEFEGLYEKWKND